MIRILPLALLGMLASCTSVEVDPVPDHVQLRSVVIQENPKVAVDDFLEVLVERFEDRGIHTRIVPETAPVGDDYIVSYVAFRNWDLAPYLRDATVEIHQRGQLIGRAVYHLRGGGGMSLLKWRGTRSKMGPVLDDLLANQGEKN